MGSTLVKVDSTLYFISGTVIWVFFSSMKMSLGGLKRPQKLPILYIICIALELSFFELMHFFWVQSISNISVCFPAQYSLYTNPPAESLGIKYDYNDIIDGSLYHLCDDDDDGDDDDDDNARLDPQPFPSFKRLPLHRDLRLETLQRWKNVEIHRSVPCLAFLCAVR